MADENCWRTNSFRQSIVAKIDEAIRTSGMTTARNSLEMENHVFQKAKTKEEYLGFVARLILHVREIKTKQGGGMAGPGPGQGGPGMPDPINALQNLASQGTRNPLMNMGPQPGQMAGQQQATATNLLQTLNRGPGQQMMMGNMPGNMSGAMSMQMCGYPNRTIKTEPCEVGEYTHVTAPVKTEIVNDEDILNFVDEQQFISENRNIEESITTNHEPDLVLECETDTQLDEPGTSSDHVSVEAGENIRQRPLKKRRRVAVDRSPNRIKYRSNMTKLLQRKFVVKRSYYEMKLKLMRRDVEAKERIAAALEKRSFHS